MLTTAETNDVLDFWFAELTPEQHFRADPAVDEACAARFGPLYERIMATAPVRAADDPDTTLAMIIVLDQFTRNMFRGTPDAFAGDDLALRIARDAVERGIDQQLEPDRRLFLYMPFMHAESLGDQELGVQLFGALGLKENLDYMIAHRDIIALFGRFPHRNAILGRASTPEETEFMKSHKGF